MYSKILSLRFPKQVAHQPIAVNLVRNFDLSFNILQATIYPRKEGLMVLELSGHKKNFQRGVRYLKTLGIKVESLAQDIKRDEDKCFHCGACTAVCPTGALSVSRPDMHVLFDKEKCSGCEWCVPVCPAHAMEVRLNKAILS
ncbi:MAG: (Fe-S)-binding protein [Thermoplasmata archaeon]|nr:MAG: (Fe-S)-binding protein [Desulfobacteraceae bacterium 4484_190.3]RLB17190.1 MAG: (Fe-S)-binding protein [Deltaproteobacteria bacterium]RLF53282.1 MAG: (Fe-S)-binding protein [Thermoplasmata archaeon]HDZ23735.1 4Fe-4S dicluster domain-containing protein [Desulfobacteraceae bacterium]